MKDIERKMIEWVNKERRQRGLTSLRPSEHLCNVARKHSKEQMLSFRIYHDSPWTGTNHSDRLKEANYPEKASAENVATAPDLRMSHNGLMKSLGHYQNIVGDYEEIGIGITRSVFGQLYVTQLFATPFVMKNVDMIKSNMIDQIRQFRQKRSLRPVRVIELESLRSYIKREDLPDANRILRDAVSEMRRKLIEPRSAHIYTFKGQRNTAQHEQMQIMSKNEMNGLSMQFRQNKENGLMLGIIILMQL